MIARPVIPDPVDTDLCEGCCQLVATYADGSVDSACICPTCADCGELLDDGGACPEGCR